MGEACHTPFLLPATKLFITHTEGEDWLKHDFLTQTNNKETLKFVLLIYSIRTLKIDSTM